MRKVALQVLFWSIFFLGWQRVVYGYVDNMTNRLLFTAFDAGQIMLVFYLTYFFVTPHFFPRRNKLPFLLLMLTTVLLAGWLLVYLMQYFLHHQILPIHFNFSWNYDDLVANRYIIALLGALAGFIGKLFIEWFHAKRKIAETEKLRVAAELSLLKTQVNPHFLFNAINTVYIQIDESPAAAQQTLSAFADMLRYQLYECNHDQVAIEKEVDYLQHYVALQQMRLDDRYAIHFHFDAQVRGFTIAPFLLLPLIENMFKHVSDTAPAPVIHGTLHYNKGLLTFHGINSKDAGRTSGSTGGIGLSNLEKRLQLLYPNRHQLIITDSGDKFDVWLKLQPI